MGKNGTTLVDFVGVSSARKVTDDWKLQWSGSLPPLAETRKVRMLRVTAVLLADDDGKRATGILKQGGSVLPAEPVLRNPAIHTKPGEHYIDDWISLANKQLWVSGADFLLDRANVRYVLEKNTVVNSITCKTGQPALELIAKKRKQRGDNPWRDSVLMLFPWGPGAEPAEQGCSDGTSPFIKMAANYHDFGAKPRFVDGLPVPGNNLLTHELGHYLGLPHNFPEELHHTLRNFVLDEAINPLGFPLTEANLAHFKGINAAQIPKMRAQARKWIATWKYVLEQDSSVVGDTPVNLGMGLPAVMGDPIGSGNQTYEVERFTDMTTTEESSFGTPKGDGKPVIEKVPLNKDVRLNVMGYWYSNVFGQRFSKGQVAQMQKAVDTTRASAVDRTVTVKVVVSPTKIDVTETLFSLPPFLLQSAEDVRFEIRKPTAREVENALARVQRPTAALGVREMSGNKCGIKAKPVERLT